MTVDGTGAEPYAWFEVKVYIPGSDADDASDSEIDGWMGAIDRVRVRLEALAGAEESRLSHRWPGSAIEVVTK